MLLRATLIAAGIAITTRRLLLVASMGAVATAAIVGAPPAHADENDFLDQLTAQGIYYRDRAGMGQNGVEVCKALRDIGGHYTTASIMDDLVTAGGFTAENAARIILTAARTMCPEQVQRLQDEANAAERPKMNPAI
jgi:hypothetical protein